MKILIHYGERIEEEVIDTWIAPAAIERVDLVATPLCSGEPVPVVKAFLSGKADGFPIYRVSPEKAL